MTRVVIHGEHHRRTDAGAALLREFGFPVPRDPLVDLEHDLDVGAVVIPLPGVSVAAVDEACDLYVVPHGLRHFTQPHPTR